MGAVSSTATDDMVQEKLKTEALRQAEAKSRQELAEKKKIKVDMEIAKMKNEEEAIQNIKSKLVFYLLIGCPPFTFLFLLFLSRRRQPVLLLLSRVYGSGYTL